MAAIADLLDQVRERCNFNSDNELATAIGLKRQTVHQWRHGLAPVADERIAQLCALAKADGPTWLAMIHAERAQSATERALWKLMLDRLSAAAAVVALVCVSVPGIAKAKPVDIQGFARSDIAYSVYYVRSLLAWLARMLPLRPSPQLRRNLANA